MTPKQSEIAACLKGRRLTCYQIAKELGAVRQTTARHLDRMQLAGLIEPCEPPKTYKPGGPKAQHYRLTQKGNKEHVRKGER